MGNEMKKLNFLIVTILLIFPIYLLLNLFCDWFPIIPFFAIAWSSSSYKPVLIFIYSILTSLLVVFFSSMILRMYRKYSKNKKMREEEILREQQDGLRRG
jgi:membrane protein implicated in regulation of membrane protease activity